MNALLPFLLPLAAAIIYVFGVLFTKRAAGAGANVYCVTFFSNIVCAVFFASLIFFFPGTFHGELIYQPAIVGALFLLGQLLAFMALDRGDISVATPVLSLKIILVALFSSVLMAIAIPWTLWVAAGLSALGITLLSRSGKKSTKPGAAVLFTVGASGLAALSFALFDVLVMKYAPTWGFGVFLPVMLGFVALFSLPLFLFFRTSIPGMQPQTWRWLMTGCVFIAMQSVLFVSTVAALGGATTANVVYATRGLWSVIVVWLFGQHFGSAESRSGVNMPLRLASAGIIAVAVVLALYSR